MFGPIDMDPIYPSPLSRLERLPPSFPTEGAVRIELDDGFPVFRASARVQERVEALVDRQREGELCGERVETVPTPFSDRGARSRRRASGLRAIGSEVR